MSPASRLTLDEPIEVAGLRILPFAVPGKVALYLERGEPAIGGESEDTIGLEVARGRRALLSSCRAAPV